MDDNDGITFNELTIIMALDNDSVKYDDDITVNGDFSILFKYN